MPKLRVLPHPGDKLEHCDTQAVFIIVTLLSENRWIVRREDGCDALSNHPYGYPPDHMQINEAIWLVRHGVFKVVRT